MSIIIAIREGSEIFVGCDKQITIGMRRLISRDDVIKANKVSRFVIESYPIIIGSVGSAKLNNYHYKLADIICKEISDDTSSISEMLIHSAIPKIQSFMEWNGHVKQNSDTSKKSNQNTNRIDGKILIVIRNMMFVIDSDYAVYEYNDICAIGSGDLESMSNYQLYKSQYNSPPTMICEMIRNLSDSFTTISPETVGISLNKNIRFQSKIELRISSDLSGDGLYEYDYNN